MRKLLPPHVFYLCIVGMIVTRGFAFDDFGYAVPMIAAGAALVLAGLGLAAACSRRFHRLGTNIKTFDPPGLLVRDGWFRFSRNPMYLGFTIVLVGVASALGNPALLVFPAFFFALADRWYIPFEERAMAERFGADYNEYRSSTRRWL